MLEREEIREEPQETECNKTPKYNVQVPHVPGRWQSLAVAGAWAPFRLLTNELKATKDVGQVTPLVWV